MHSEKFFRLTMDELVLLAIGLRRFFKISSRSEQPGAFWRHGNFWQNPLGIFGKRKSILSHHQTEVIIVIAELIQPRQATENQKILCLIRSDRIEVHSPVKWEKMIRVMYKKNHSFFNKFEGLVFIQINTKLDEFIYMIICLLICPNFSVVFWISVWTYYAVKRQLSKSHLLFCFLGYMEHYLSSELKTKQNT